MEVGAVTRKSISSRCVRGVTARYAGVLKQCLIQVLEKHIVEAAGAGPVESSPKRFV